MTQAPPAKFKPFSQKIHEAAASLDALTSEQKANLLVRARIIKQEESEAIARRLRQLFKK